MKKLLKIIGTLLIVIVLLLVSLPYLFKDKIEALIKEEGNKMLNAEFDFVNLDISLISNFPLASLTIEDFYLKGIDRFSADTLVSAGEVTAAVNLMSLFGDEGYDIKKILLDDVSLKAVVLSDGAVNWDVMKSADTDETVVEADTASSPFRIKLQELAVNNLNIIYDDRMGNMYAQIEQFDATCSGDFGSVRTLLDLQADIAALTFRMDGVPLLNKAQIAADMNIDADLLNSKFTLKENTLRLNAIEAAVDGWIALAETGMDMDLKLNSNKVGFKEVLSLIPAIYMTDFDGLKTDGKATLSAYAKGTLSGDSIMPEFALDFGVQNAMFRYPSLPAGVNDINIVAKVSNPGGSLDNTIVDVNKFAFSLAGNAFGMTALLKNPMSDMSFDMTAKGRLDLGKVKDIYPLENMNLSGVVDADMAVNGRMSYIEKEQYEKVGASGSLSLSDMVLKIQDMPDVDIKKSVLAFTPRYLQLSETTVNIGNNDLAVNSKFENYLGYLFKGTVLKGSLNVKSNNFNLNDFMTADTAAVVADAGTAAVADTVATGVITIPDNIDFDMNADFAKVHFGKMLFEKLNGKLVVKNGKVDMKNLSLNTMGGSMVVNGYYDTPSNTRPRFNAALKLNEIGFAQAYKDLDMVQSMAPVFNGLTGSFSGSMNIDTELDDTMSPVLETLDGSGSLTTKDLSLNNVTVIQQVADIIKRPSLKDTSVKNLNLQFAINDGRVSTKPFDITLGECKMTLSGSTGLDKSIDYKGEITIPESAGKLSQLGTVDMAIGGTFTSPKVSIDMESLAKKAATKAAENAIDKLLDGKKESSDSDDTTKDKKSDAVKNIIKGLIK